MHTVLILTGGPAKDVGILMAKPRSRSLLKLPGKTLLTHIIESFKNIAENIIVAYDDPQVPLHCTSCKTILVEASTIHDTLCAAYRRLRLGSEDTVTIVYGDVYGEPELYRGHLLVFERENEPVVTVTKPVVMRGNYLRLRVNESGLVEGIGFGDYVYAGLISLHARDFAEVCSVKSVVKLFEKLASKRLYAHIWLGPWVDVDTPWDYMVAARYELEKIHGLHVSEEARISERAELEPPLVIEKGARVDANAVVRGPAYISSGSLIGAHSFIRNSVLVLENAIVGAFTEVKRSVICSSAYIGSHSYVVDSVVGEEASLAPYTVTRNIPYRELPDNAKVLLTTTHPLEGVKIGAVIAAKAKTNPHSVIEAATTYKG